MLPEPFAACLFNHFQQQIGTNGLENLVLVLVLVSWEDMEMLTGARDPAELLPCALSMTFGKEWSQTSILRRYDHPGGSIHG